MKNQFLLLILPMLLTLSCSRNRSPVKPGMTGGPVDYVNPLMGSASTYNLSTGNTYPAVAVPWGMNFWTPQTGADGDGWTYRYDATHIRGLKQTHQPSPWINDYGAFSLMPVTTGPYMDQEARGSWFSHKTETATPYYYSVYLADHDVLAELTPTSRAAVFRFTYPEAEMSYLVVDGFPGGSQLHPDGNRVTGWNAHNHGGVAEGFRNYLVLESDTPFTVIDREEGDHAQLLLGFPTTKGQVVEVRVASSFISQDQALTNLEEVKGKPFEEVKADARKAWNEALGRVEVEDGNLDHLRTFYSCLYRTLLFPRDLSEITAAGERVHYSPHNGQVEKGYFFTDTGFWDTFRSLFPLLNLLYPEQSAKVQEGLVNDYLESGFLPEWASPGHRDCMVGNNSASVVADAWLKGIRGYDIGALWEAVTHGAHAVHPGVSSTGRAGWRFYDSLGYVPCDVGVSESAARTLEYAYDDWCIWQLGKVLGKPEEALEPYRKAALNYRNLYDPEYGLMNGKSLSGTFRRPFSPLKWGGDFTEGNSLHYTWSVFHDPAGLIGLMGGPEAFAAQLDTVFAMPPRYDDSYYGFPIHEIVEMTVMNMGNYAHGNQPVQHMLYLYDWCGQPWKAQARIREVMEKFYTPWADGYCGDEDNGQTSAWYVFSALGFYPVCPGSGEYALGTPLFRKATLHLTGGDVVIEAPGAEGCYVRRLTLNGTKWTRNYLRHSDLVKGARLRFTLSSVPELSRGTAPEDRPYSFSSF
ncbi:MAG: GH92 family glycosyl hydrolase [Bacteroidales bacterium]|nr:GH92 family glycosyl hydrolase [Bacteroidales bacterium]MBR1571096.1 GH92 family glycosyl hydrolase [Bacteroidales bacterium]